MLPQRATAGDRRWRLQATTGDRGRQQATRRATTGDARLGILRDASNAEGGQMSLSQVQKVERRELRCRGCTTLLAVLDRGEFVIERSGMQARFDGSSRATIVCYRCQRLNLFRSQR